MRDEYTQKLIGEKMPGGFFIYSAENGKILYINDITMSIYGCSTQEQFFELTGGTFRGMVYPEDYARVEESISRQVSESTEKLDYVEYRIRRKDGEIRRVDDYGCQVHTEEGDDVYYVLIRDITEVYAAREQSAQRAEVIAGLSEDYVSIFLLDLDTGDMEIYRLTDSCFLQQLHDGVYRNYEELFTAYAQNYVIKEDQREFTKQAERSRIRERVAKERSYTFLYRILEENYAIRFMEVSVVGIGEEESPNRVVIGFRDETENTQRIHNDLADRLNMELDLERERNANEIKSNFLFNISHDIRTPMNAIKGFTDLALCHLDEPEKIRDYLTRVQESNRHMIALIDDLLEMGRIDYGSLELREEPCSIRESIDVVLHMFRAQMEEKGVTLEEDLQLPVQKVYLDAVCFQRIISNLVGNAVKFTPRGGRIRVSSEKKETGALGRIHYEFRISDTGIGMSKEFMKHLFEAFEREESSTRSGNRGTGLGLSIAKKLLLMMDGTISAVSRKGEGSSFIVNLPLRLVDNSVADVGAIKEEQEFKDQHRILLVEDIEINRILAESILEDEGFLVDSVPDGSDAVELVRQKPVWYYDLILMDIQMPVMNGYEATRSIRAMDREDAALVPIIALSANARDEDKRMSLESGMNSHVAKPFDITNLVGAINEHIRRTRH